MTNLNPANVSEKTVHAAAARPPRRRRWIIGVPLAVVVLVAATLSWRGYGSREDAHDPPPAPSKDADVFTAIPGQMREIRVEPVQDRIIQSDLQTTGKIGFN